MLLGHLTRESSVLTIPGGNCAVYRTRLGQVRILRKLKHPNVIKIYQFFKDDPDNYYEVMEFVEGGELFDRIVKKVREVQSST